MGVLPKIRIFTQKFLSIDQVMRKRTKHIKSNNRQVESRTCRIAFVHWFSGFL